jgi:hypothetical protein
VTDYDSAVWTWSQHLRHGGSTPWARWRSGTHEEEPPPGWSPPGAAQLEVVRRAALRPDTNADVLAALADVVLSRSGPGRGRAWQPVDWPGAAARAFGAPAVDPADVPVPELLRVATGALTELALRPGDADPAIAVPRRRGLLTRTPAFELAGSPVTTSAVRRELASRGHVEGGRRPTVVLLVEPLDQALAQVWSARVQRGAPVRWSGFVDRWAGRRDLPPSADVAAIAAVWADRVGADHVHVVPAPASVDEAVRSTTAAIGLRPGRPGNAGPARWWDLSPAAVDALRRVNSVLNVRVAEQRADRARNRAREALAASSRTRPGATPDLHRWTVPDAHRDWVDTRAQRLADDLSHRGYAVHGRLDRVVPGVAGLPTQPRGTDVLDLLLGACLHRLSPSTEPAQRTTEGAPRP